MWREILKNFGFLSGSKQGHNAAKEKINKLVVDYALASLLELKHV